VLPAPHGLRLAHDVLPGTQKPPCGVVAHTQSGFVLHGRNVAQLAPAHSGFGLPDTCAAAGVTDARIIGATYPAPPTFSARRISSRRLTFLG
jgi:hypothetical protein